MASAEINERLYRSLYRIRRVEEKVAAIYPTDKIKSPVHLSIGQEAVSVGVCDALRKGDVVFGTYRSHALYLAKGGDLKKMMAELYGKVTGCARGKGGSMHLIDVGAGVMGASSVVGTSIPQAVGYAYAIKLRRGPEIVVSVFGEGAVEEGAFHESLNFAALKKLPVLFVCENNFYSIHSPLDVRQSNDRICDRARSHGMPAERVVDGNVMTIRSMAERASAQIRLGRGPSFLECLTYRWKEHVGPNSDFDAGYRDVKEAEPWIESDPVKIMGEIASESRGRIEAEVDAEILDAIQFAETSAFPGAEDLYRDVFREP